MCIVLLNGRSQTPMTVDIFINFQFIKFMACNYAADTLYSSPFKSESEHIRTPNAD